MKRWWCVWVLSGLLLWGFTASAQEKAKEEKLGLPGDNLNLFAVMKLFQESETLEAFEKKLNEEDAKVNNLDLDGDDKIDYIRVLDEVEGDVHTIILQVDVNPNEKQDVAVFTVEKLKENEVRIQLTGDEELYGKDYIVEPNYTEAESGGRPNPGYSGKVQQIEDKQVEVVTTTYVEVAAWPVVRFVFMPSYVVWRSPWYWGYYPGWWRPWRPWYWHYYYGYHYNYYSYYYGWYRPWHHHRYPHWNDQYYNRRRVHSVYVHNRRRDGAYNNTYTRPELRRDGMQLYTKNNPKAPVLRPGVNRPAPRPVAPGGGNQPTRPAAKPGTNQPNKPVTRPVQRPVQKPAQKPATRPAVKPASKPAPRPAAKPPAKKPVTRPAPKQGTGNDAPLAKVPYLIRFDFARQVVLWPTSSG